MRRKTLRHETDQALEPRGAKRSRARPSCPALKAKQGEERPAGLCRGRAAAPLAAAGEPGAAPPGGACSGSPLPRALPLPD